MPVRAEDSTNVVGTLAFDVTTVSTLLPAPRSCPGCAAENDCRPSGGLRERAVRRRLARAKTSWCCSRKAASRASALACGGSIWVGLGGVGGVEWCQLGNEGGIQ